ncbi:MAG: 4'-phosphopantetheinyl transferase superfamily protein [bacterium]|nr:4'-phosphopantetheinyl transferase superfamily protein [bacterium]
MPLVLHKIIEPHANLAVWHIQESNEELLNSLGKNYFENEHHVKINQANARHYLASRILLTELFPKHQIVLTKNENNKPSLQLDGKPFSISITHSFDYAAILIAETGHLGLDLEKIDNRIGRVKHKFMNQEELAFAGEEDQIKAQTLIWSTKETLYKIYSNKELDFKKNLHISAFTIQENGLLKTNIINETMNQEIWVQYQQIDQYFLTYSSLKN